MDSILKAFSIGFLLRSFFSGIFFVISYYVASHGLEGLKQIEDKSMSSTVLLVALFAGVTAYGVHRSLVYPWIESFFDSRLGKTLRKWFPLISKSTIHTLLWRWNQGATLKCKQINKHLNTWADFIHLQFTSSVCIGLGALLSWFTVNNPHFCPLIYSAGFLFLAAFVSNWRSHSVLDYVRERPGRE
jgi:hypothetical protein